MRLPLRWWQPLPDDQIVLDSTEGSARSRIYANHRMPKVTSTSIYQNVSLKNEEKTVRRLGGLGRSSAPGKD